MQIKHMVHDGMTLAMEMPSRSDVLLARSQMEAGLGNPSLTFGFGLARLNPADKHYVKKIGRETAIKNVKSVQGELISTTSTGNTIWYTVEVSIDGRVFNLSCKIPPGQGFSYYHFH